MQRTPDSFFQYKRTKGTDASNSATSELLEKVSQSRFLVLGAAGTIGQAVTKEIFKRNPAKLHAVDISENNLVELVRNLRSEYGYIEGDFQTFALDIGSDIYDAFIASDGPIMYSKALLPRLYRKGIHLINYKDLGLYPSIYERQDAGLSEGHLQM